MQTPPDGTGRAPVPQAWDADLAPLLRAPAGRLWRVHCDAVNAALIARWVAGPARGLALKTDLFDEAMGEGLRSQIEALGFDLVAIDIAPSVRRAASSRHRSLRIAAADVRRLPFADGAFDLIVSNSTLDHFDSRAEIREALRGLNRVLKPGGLLLITMDNLRHPGVALRNALPHEFLRRIGLVKYPAGATVGPRGLARLLRDAGFDLLHSAAILHCPRALAVHRALTVERNGSPARRQRFLRHLTRWEALERLPTRFLTAHFVGMLASKP